MRAVLRKPRKLRQIDIGHKDVWREAHLGRVRRNIGPVRLEYLARLVRNAYLAQHLVTGLGHKAHKVIVFQHHFDLLRALRLVVPLIQPLHAVHQHPPELQHRRHGFPAAGHLPLHLVDEVLHARGHGDVEAVRVCRNGSEALIGAAPFHVQPVVVLKKLAHRAALPLPFARAHLAQLVQGGLKLVLPAHEASGAATGEIVLFQHKHLLAGLCEICRGRKAAVARADNDHVVFLHLRVLR